MADLLYCNVNRDRKLLLFYLCQYKMSHQLYWYWLVSQYNRVDCLCAVVNVMVFSPELRNNEVCTVVQCSLARAVFKCQRWCVSGLTITGVLSAPMRGWPEVWQNFLFPRAGGDQDCTVGKLGGTLIDFEILNLEIGTITECSVLVPSVCSLERKEESMTIWPPEFATVDCRNNGDPPTLCLLWYLLFLWSCRLRPDGLPPRYGYCVWSWIRVRHCLPIWSESNHKYWIFQSYDSQNYIHSKFSCHK